MDTCDKVRFSELFQSLQQDVHQLAKDKGWYERERNELELIALIHNELGEATEAIREGSMSPKILGYKGVEEELADTIIRIMDMAGYLGLDIAGAIIDKHEYNKSRTYRHGGKKY